MIFATPEAEGVPISGKNRKHLRIYCHASAIDLTISRSKSNAKPHTFLRVVVGMLILERLKDVMESAVKHPLTDYLKDTLVNPYETYRIDLSWFTFMILGDLVNTPEYQLLSVNFAIQPLYFELLDTYYNFGNSRYVINETVDTLSKDGAFLRHLVYNLEVYKQSDPRCVQKQM